MTNSIIVLSDEEAGAVALRRGGRERRLPGRATGFENHDERLQSTLPITRKQTAADTEEEEENSAALEPTGANKRIRRRSELDTSEVAEDQSAPSNDGNDSNVNSHSQTDITEPEAPTTEAGETITVTAPIVAEIVPTEAQQDATADCKYFFSLEPDGKHVKCKIACCPHPIVVKDVSTRRKHMQGRHKDVYQKWCLENKFLSMLPKDVQARKEKAAEGSTGLVQQTIEGTIVNGRKGERFSNAEVQDAAIQWLLETDQPISAFENGSFKRLMYVSSKCTAPISLPDRRATRAGILKRFGNYMADLKERMEKAPGKISLTFDAWQASNVDSYLATTAHWIEITDENDWNLKGGIIGFVRVNASHNAKTMARVLLEIIKRVGIASVLGWITGDNTNANPATMRVMSELMKTELRIDWDWLEFFIRCLSHVINIATQKLISTQSLTPFYNPHEPSAVEDAATSRDVLGKIRAISVKNHSSSKRKELFYEVQKKTREALESGKSALPSDSPPSALVAISTASAASANTSYQLRTIEQFLADLKRPKTLKIDMKVRWSSTNDMLMRAWRMRPAVDSFIRAIAGDEPNAEKAVRLHRLKLTTAEWDYTEKFLRLLERADSNQQKFSSDTYPCLHNAIPALESLHEKWLARSTAPGYSHFSVALTAACAKVEEYYNHTENSPAYIMSMVLNPDFKLKYFKEHWDSATYRNVIALVEKIYHARYNNLLAAGKIGPFGQKARKKRASSYHGLVMSDDEGDEPADSTPNADDRKSSLEKYLNADDELLNEDDNPVKWWGRNHPRFGAAWKSLALDYLAIMASSVSSERAFSAAGLTITKRRNRLKGDIVEAIQILKGAMKKGLYKSSQQPTYAEEVQMDQEEVVEESLLESIGNEVGGNDFDIDVLDDDCFEGEGEDTAQNLAM